MDRLDGLDEFPTFYRTCERFLSSMQSLMLNERGFLIPTFSTSRMFAYIGFLIIIIVVSIV